MLLHDLENTIKQFNLVCLMPIKSSVVVSVLDCDIVVSEFVL